MGWAENHLDRLNGIESAAEKRLPGCFTCHKCGGDLGAPAQVEALVVRYTVPGEWSDGDGSGLHRWSIVCRDCEFELTTRAVERGRPLDSGPGQFLP